MTIKNLANKCLYRGFYYCKEPEEPKRETNHGKPESKKEKRVE